jgi:hypothetical protein
LDEVIQLSLADKATLQQVLEGRFEVIVDTYFDLLDDESVITARYVAQYVSS